MLFLFHAVSQPDAAAHKPETSTAQRHRHTDTHIQTLQLQAEGMSETTYFKITRIFVDFLTTDFNSDIKTEYINQK